MPLPAPSTRIIQLRDVTEDDLPIFFEHQREPEANQMAAFPARSREAFMAHWTKNILGHEAVPARTILLKGQVAGHVLLMGPWDRLQRLVMDFALWQGASEAAIES